MNKMTNVMNEDRR